MMCFSSQENRDAVFYALTQKKNSRAAAREITIGILDNCRSPRKATSLEGIRENFINSWRHRDAQKE